MLYFIQSIDLLAAGEAFLHWFRIIRPPDDTKIDAFLFGGSGSACFFRLISRNIEKAPFRG